MYGAMLLLGLGLMVCCPAGAAVHYADADTLAHAPACARGVDLAMSSADCVGTLTMTHDHGVYPDDSDDYAIDLDAPDANEPLDYETAVFPASTEFSDAAGESGTVRAQFWEGRIVALTATSGDRSVYVVTDANPGIPAGTAISFALFGTSLVLLALLLFGVARPVRRWLPTGVFTRLALTGIAIGAVGCFFTGIGLILQPERVLLAGVLGPSITGGVIALFWITLYGQSRRTRRIGLIPSTR